MSIASIVTRGYGSWSNVTCLATRGYDCAEVAEVLDGGVTSNELYLRFELSPLIVRFFKQR